MRIPCISFVIFCAFAVGCRAPLPDWNGKWKLNPSKGNFQGPVFTISFQADGEYRYDDGYSSFILRCDGKDRPVGNNRTRACVKTSTTILEMTQRENGVKTLEKRWELSADRRILTSTETAFRPSEPSLGDHLIASRISGSNDFVGQWRDMTYLRRRAYLIVTLDSQTLHLGYSGAGQYLDAPLDGAEVVMHSSRAPDGITYSVRRSARREFLILTKRNGKVLTQRSMELSKDGKIIIYSWWDPDRPTDKETLVYERE